MRGIEFARHLRNNQTPQEQKLWARLRDRRLNGFKFRRQHPDFCKRFMAVCFIYCAAANLIVEVDGGGHADQVEYDQDCVPFDSIDLFRS